MNDDTADTKTLYCSFCGKARYEVVRLVAGPSTFICDECIMMCLDIIAKEGWDAADTTRDDDEPERKGDRVFAFVAGRLGQPEESKKATDKRLIYCVFCGRHQLQADRIVAGPAAAVCDNCALICMNVVATRGYKGPAESRLDNPDDKLRDEIYALIRARLGYTKKD